RHVGARHGLCRSFAAGKLGNAEAGAETDMRRHPFNRQAGECGARILGKKTRRGEVASRQHAGEFLAADPADGVILASSLTEYARESGDDPISAGVTVSVVDRLEVIEVAQNERDGRLASGVAGQDTVQPFGKAAAVEQAGEGVRARLFGDLVK